MMITFFVVHGRWYDWEHIIMRIALMAAHNYPLQTADLHACKGIKG